jgi:hypothetical protein
MSASGAVDAEHAEQHELTFGCEEEGGEGEHSATHTAPVQAARVVHKAKARRRTDDDDDVRSASASLPELASLAVALLRRSGCLLPRA